MGMKLRTKRQTIQSHAENYGKQHKQKNARQDYKANSKTLKQSLTKMLTSD